MERLWFKAKQYGWGWYPVTWEGWLVTLGYIASAFLLIHMIDPSHRTASQVFTSFIIPFAILTAILLAVCFATGEKPSWRWGN